MAWGSHSEKEMIIGKVICEISRKYDVHNNYETDYKTIMHVKYKMIPCSNFREEVQCVLTT